MSKQIVIGTQGNQSFPIPDQKVSRRHAFLNIQPGGQLFLIDNSSTNGTFIYNGSTFVRLYPNQPYPVNPDTMIQLGPETRFHIRRLLTAQQPVPGDMANGATGQAGVQQQPISPKKPKRVDISHLRKISEDYDEQKMHIDSKTGMINGLRGLSLLITMLAGGVGTFLTENSSSSDKSQSTIIVIVVAVLLTIVLQYSINRYNKSLIRRRKDNEHNYAVKYVCPECHVSFRGKIYENILAERCCPKCKTEYYDKNVKN